MENRRLTCFSDKVPVPVMNVPVMVFCIKKGLLGQEQEPLRTVSFCRAIIIGYSNEALSLTLCLTYTGTSTGSVSASKIGLAG
jgi:hypothetical protein